MYLQIEELVSSVRVFRLIVDSVEFFVDVNDRGMGLPLLCKVNGKDICSLSFLDQIKAAVEAWDRTSKSEAGQPREAFKPITDEKG